MFDKLIAKILIYFSLLLCCFISSQISAESFQKIELNEEEYILVDMRVRDWSLLTDIEVFQVGEQLYIPYLTVIEALELKHSSRVNEDYLHVTLDSKSNWIDFIKQKTNLDADMAYYWASNDYDRFISMELFSKLINAEFEYESSRLRINITPKDPQYYFPIEKRMNRSQEDKRVRKTTGGISSSNIRYFKSEEVLLDHYHLITPPSGNVGLNLFAKNEQGIDYSLSTSLSADMFYHSATLSLSKSNNSDLKGYLRFRGAPTSPYEILPFGITYYDFGDISASNTGGSAGGSGIGVTFRSSTKDYSRDFGSTVIEGQAVPGWDVELYADGFFIAQQKVSENGTYKFENVTTEYGTNTFKVKLYGPYGESEERIETLNISGNWLKPGQVRFKGGILESNQYTLQGGLEDGYSPDNIYYGLDYGISDKYQLGLTLSAQQDSGEQFNKEIKVNLQATFTDLLLDNELALEDNGDINAYISGQGAISQTHSYGFRYNYNLINIDNGQSNRSNDSHSLALNFGGSNKKYIPISYSFGTNVSTFNSGIKLTRLSNRLSWVTKSFNVYNNVAFINSSENPYYSGVFGFSSKFHSGRVSAEVGYKYEDEFSANNTRVSIYQDFDNGYSVSGTAEYKRDIKENDFSLNKEYEDDWRITASLTKSFDDFQLSGSIIQDDEHNWAVGVGVNFSLGYDHVNNKIKVSNGGLFGGGTLDLTAFLDRNSNNILDENDLALSGVEFGPYTSWKEYKTGPTGRVVLQGVPTNQPMNFTGYLQRGISPSVSSYTLYTHSGGYIKANIPFTIKTDVIGYLFIDGNDGEVAVKEASIELVDQKGEVISKSETSHDGYYEFIGVNAGIYRIRIAQSFLDKRGLKSQPSEYLLESPAQGGFVEISPMVLHPVNKKMTIKNLVKVEFNNDNYDPSIPKEQATKGLYIKPVAGVVQKTNINRKPIKLKTAVSLKPKTKLEKRIEIDNNELTSPSNLGNTSSPVVELPSQIDKIDWIVQFGSFENEVNANQSLSEINKIIPNINLSIIKEGMFFKLIKTNFDNEAEAINFSNEVNTSFGLKTFHVKSTSNTPSSSVLESVSFKGKYFIQIASVVNISSANVLVEKVRGFNQLYLSKNDSKNLVLIGVFNTKNEASEQLLRVKSNFNIDGWVRKADDLNNLNIL